MGTWSACPVNPLEVGELVMFYRTIECGEREVGELAMFYRTIECGEIIYRFMNMQELLAFIVV